MSIPLVVNNREFGFFSTNCPALWATKQSPKHKSLAPLAQKIQRGKKNTQLSAAVIHTSVGPFPMHPRALLASLWGVSPSGIQTWHHCQVSVSFSLALPPSGWGLLSWLQVFLHLWSPNPTQSGGLPYQGIVSRKGRSVACPQLHLLSSSSLVWKVLTLKWPIPVALPCSLSLVTGVKTPLHGVLFYASKLSQCFLWQVN